MNSGKKTGQGPYAVLGLVFEFLGILGFLPFLGYLADRHLLQKDSLGWFFFAGCALGFGFGIYHLYRRAQDFMEQPDVGDISAPRNSRDGREGYPARLREEVERLREGLDDVGRRIDEASEHKKGGKKEPSEDD